MGNKKPSDDIDRHIGARVRFRRKQVGVSAQELAAAIGVGFRQISKYEIGRDRLSASLLFKIAQALDVRPEYFYPQQEEE